MEAVKLFNTAEVLRITKGSLIAGLRGDAIVSHVEVDTRKLIKNSLFVALKGTQSDGHNYLEGAANQGASMALVSTSYRPTQSLMQGSMQLIAVQNPLVALQQLAKAWVDSFSNLVRVGVTGSCGKTTTKEILTTILGAVGPSVCNPGNYNSNIGLPLSLFHVRKEHKFGVFEMGIDHVGEMGEHVDTFSPDYALLTTIGMAHLENFSSPEELAREKGSIFHDGVRGSFVGETNPWNDFLAKELGKDFISYGLKTSTGFRGAENLGLDGWNINYEGQIMHLNLIGEHNLRNTLGAIAVAREFGATPSQVAEGVGKVQPIAGRSRVVKSALGETIIEDTYNANLESSGKILDYIETLRWGGRRNLVMGSMKELGQASHHAHQELGKKILHLNPESAYLFGYEMEDAYNALKKGGYSKNLYFTTEYEELENKVLSDRKLGDLVLLKGSRSMHLERLMDPLCQIS